MTTVVALHTPGKGTIMASDTQLTMGTGLVSYYPQGKIIAREGWAVAITGAFKTLTLLERHVDALFEKVEDVHDILDRIAAMTKEYGFNTTVSEDSGVPMHDNSLIIANSAGVWDIDGSFAPAPVSPYELTAAGSGQAYAFGAGHATRGQRDPVKRAITALEAAMRYDRGTGGEIVMLSLPLKKTRS